MQTCTKCGNGFMAYRIKLIESVTESKLNKKKL